MKIRHAITIPAAVALALGIGGNAAAHHPSIAATCRDGKPVLVVELTDYTHGGTLYVNGDEIATFAHAFAAIYKLGDPTVAHDITVRVTSPDHIGEIDPAQNRHVAPCQTASTSTTSSPTTTTVAPSTTTSPPAPTTTAPPASTSPTTTAVPATTAASSAPGPLPSTSTSSPPTASSSSTTSSPTSTEPSVAVAVPVAGGPPTPPANATLPSTGSTTVPIVLMGAAAITAGTIMVRRTRPAR